MTRFPPLAVFLGLAGLIPFAGLGFLSIMPDPNARHLTLLLAWGAVILSFLGGVHEGFALMAPAPLPNAKKEAGDWKQAENRRLLGGSACALVAWLDLAAAAYLPVWVPLVILIVAFAALPVLEQRASGHGWVPSGYMLLRWALSTGVIVVLGAVLVLRWTGVAAPLG